MLVFIDDSGDPGVKINEGSSRFFVLTAIKFLDNLEAEEASLILKRYKRAIKMNDEEEVKFNKLSLKRRIEVLKLFKDVEFDICTMYQDKSEGESIGKIDYVDYINLFLKTFEQHFSDSKIIIDGGHDRVYLKDFYTNITTGSNISSRNIRVKDSKNNSLLQLADIFAGASHLSLKNDFDYLKKYKVQIKRFK